MLIQEIYYNRAVVYFPNPCRHGYRPDAHFVRKCDMYYYQCRWEIRHLQIPMMPLRTWNTWLCPCSPLFFPACRVWEIGLVKIDIDIYIYIYIYSRGSLSEIPSSVPSREKLPYRLRGEEGCRACCSVEERLDGLLDSGAGFDGKYQILSDDCLSFSYSSSLCFAGTS
jgi:hypothetical protein